MVTTPQLPESQNSLLPQLLHQIFVLEPDLFWLD
jgi:hypothetical protein